jgi:hypothetical protein
VCFWSTATTHILADVNGWFPVNPAGFQSLVPARVFDTRNGSGGVPAAQIPTDGSLTVQMTGLNGVPATGVAAVSLNVTVTQPGGDGWITVYPCGNRPLASNLNFVSGQTVPNAVIAPVAADGKVCFYASAPTHLIADVNGWFPVNPAGFQSLTPSRVFDTRDGTGGVAAGTPVDADGTLTIQATGRNGVPGSGVAAVVLNVTVTQPQGGGWVTVYPCGNRPLASNLNFVVGQTVPNAVIAPVAADGKVCFYASAGTHLLADAAGWFPKNPAGFQAVTPYRQFDTRA